MLNVQKTDFDNLVEQIYSVELEFNYTTESNTSVSDLYSLLSIRRDSQLHTL